MGVGTCSDNGEPCSIIGLGAGMARFEKESINFKLPKLLCDRKVAKLSAGIAISAEQHFKYPNNPEIQAAWNNLLKALGKESVAQEEFVGSAIALNQE